MISREVAVATRSKGFVEITEEYICLSLGLTSGKLKKYMEGREGVYREEANDKARVKKRNIQSNLSVRTPYNYLATGQDIGNKVYMSNTSIT